MNLLELLGGIVFGSLFLFAVVSEKWIAWAAALLVVFLVFCFIARAAFSDKLSSGYLRRLFLASFLFLCSAVFSPVDLRFRNADDWGAQVLPVKYDMGYYPLRSERVKKREGVDYFLIKGYPSMNALWYCIVFDYP